MLNMAINILGYFPLIKKDFSSFLPFLLILSLITVFTVLTFMKWAFMFVQVNTFYLVSNNTNLSKIEHF